MWIVTSLLRIVGKDSYFCSAALKSEGENLEKYAGFSFSWSTKSDVELDLYLSVVVLPRSLQIMECLFLMN